MSKAPPTFVSVMGAAATEAMYPLLARLTQEHPDWRVARVCLEAKKLFWGGVYE